MKYKISDRAYIRLNKLLAKRRKTDRDMQYIFRMRHLCRLAKTKAIDDESVAAHFRSPTLEFSLDDAFHDFAQTARDAPKWLHAYSRRGWLEPNHVA